MSGETPRPAGPDAPRKESDPREREARAETVRARLRETISQKEGGMTEQEWVTLQLAFMRDHADIATAHHVTTVPQLKAFIVRAENLVDRDAASQAFYKGRDQQAVFGLLRDFAQGKLDFQTMDRTTVDQAFRLSFASMNPMAVFEEKNLRVVLTLPSRRQILLTAAYCMSSLYERRSAFFEAFRLLKNEPEKVAMLQMVFADSRQDVALRYLDDERLFPAGTLTADERRQVLAYVSRGTTPRAERPDTDLLARNEPMTAQGRRNKEVWTDPALARYDAVREEWIDWTAVERQQPPMRNERYVPRLRDTIRVQMRAMISRNLFFRGEEATRDNVRAEAARILTQRERYADVALFRGRNVVMASHGERRRNREGADAGPHFGTPALTAALRRQQGEGRDFDVIHPADESRAESMAAKKTTLEKIRGAKMPFTFVFDGHGGPTGLYFGAGQPDKDGAVNADDAGFFISPKELADALKARAAAFPRMAAAGPEQRDILVLAACYTPDFVRNLYTELGDAPKPIVLGQSEYGQYGLGYENVDVGSHFFSEVLRVKDDRPSTFGSLFRNEFGTYEHEGERIDMESNPSIYIPDERNRPRQLSNTPGSRPDLA